MPLHLIAVWSIAVDGDGHDLFFANACRRNGGAPRFRHKEVPRKPGHLIDNYLVDKNLDVNKNNLSDGVPHCNDEGSPFGLRGFAPARCARSPVAAAEADDAARLRRADAPSNS
jgi:hypothetical protein